MTQQCRLLSGYFYNRQQILKIFFSVQTHFPIFPTFMKYNVFVHWEKNMIFLYFENKENFLYDLRFECGEMLLAEEKMSVHASDKNRKMIISAAYKYDPGGLAKEAGHPSSRAFTIDRNGDLGHTCMATDEIHQKPTLTRSHKPIAIL